MRNKWTAELNELSGNPRNAVSGVGGKVTWLAGEVAIFFFVVVVLVDKSLPVVAARPGAIRPSRGQTILNHAHVELKRNN